MIIYILYLGSTTIGHFLLFAVGILDAITSTEVGTVLSVLNSRSEDELFLHISATATATTLGNRMLYPNFFRVIPDDSKQIEVRLILLYLLFLLEFYLIFTVLVL